MVLGESAFEMRMDCTAAPYLPYSQQKRPKKSGVPATKHASNFFSFNTRPYGPISI